MNIFFQDITMTDLMDAESEIDPNILLIGHYSEDFELELRYDYQLDVYNVWQDGVLWASSATRSGIILAYNMALADYRS